MSLRVRTQKIPAWPTAYDPADDDENVVRIEELRSSVATILQVDDNLEDAVRTSAWRNGQAAGGAVWQHDGSGSPRLFHRRGVQAV